MLTSVCGSVVALGMLSGNDRDIPQSTIALLFFVFTVLSAAGNLVFLLLRRFRALVRPAPTAPIAPAVPAVPAATAASSGEGQRQGDLSALDGPELALRLGHNNKDGSGDVSVTGPTTLTVTSNTGAAAVAAAPAKKDVRAILAAAMARVAAVARRRVTWHLVPILISAGMSGGFFSST